jgi:hypothetical protein
LNNINDWQNFINRNDVKNWAVKPSKPDSRDYSLSTIIKLPFIDIPKNASLDYLVPFVLDQKQTPKCCGFGITGVMNAYYNFYGKLPPNGFSPEFAYWLADEFDELPEGTEGTTIKAVLKVAHKYGMLPYNYLPFTNNHIKPKITQQMMDIASQYKIESYARLNNFTEICQAIAAGKYVLIGSIVTKNDWSDGYILNPEGDYFTGSHCSYISEYDLDMIYNNYKTFLGGYNSWSENWGLNGQYWMSKTFTEYKFKDLDMCALFEAWAINMKELPKPNEDNQKNKEVNKVIKMVIGKKEYYIDDQKFNMDTEPIIINGRTMVPVRFVAEALNCQVDYIADKKEIIITEK